MKRALALFLCILPLLAAPPRAYALTTPDGFTYALAAGEATITGYMGGATSLVLPSSVPTGEPVTAVGERAFDSTGITSLTIPEGVVSLGDYCAAFCFSLTSVSLPSTLARIESCAFMSCRSLATIDLPSGLTFLGIFAFSNCESLVSVVIPPGVTALRDFTFEHCHSLVSATLPPGLTSIGWSSFGYCYSLESADIPEGVTTVGGEAFLFCRSLSSLSLPSTLRSIGARAFGACSALASVTVPSGVISIENLTFAGCATLASVILPDTLLGIGEFAFYNCYALRSIRLPSALTDIGTRAFDGCAGLTSIHVPASVSSIGPRAFQPGTTLYGHDGSYAQEYARENGFAFVPYATGIVLSPRSANLVPGGTLRVSADVLPAGAGTEVDWTSGNSAVATVDSGGLVTAVAPGKTYVKTTAKDGSGVSGSCAITVAFPSGVVAVTGVRAVSGSALEVTWTADPGAAGYEVWWSAQSSLGYRLAKSTAALTFTKTYLPPGAPSFFRVRSFWFEGTAKVYGPYSAYKAGIPLAKPALTSATATGKDRVTLTWTTVPGAGGYQVYVSGTVGGTYRPLKTTAATQFLVTGLQPGSPYYFKVAAYKKLFAATYYGPISGYRGIRTPR